MENKIQEISILLESKVKEDLQKTRELTRNLLTEMIANIAAIFLNRLNLMGQMVSSKRQSEAFLSFYFVKLSIMDTIKLAKDSCNENLYITEVLDLIHRTRLIDKSVIPHTAEELSERYQTSVICLLDNKIIGNSSIFSTNIEEFKGQNIGEIGSVITDFNYRNMGIGHKMIEKSILKFSNYFSSVVGATINPKMYKIFIENGFIEENFPESSLEEGRKHLSSLLNGGEKEFLERAKFFRKNN